MYMNAARRHSYRTCGGERERWRAGGVALRLRVVAPAEGPRRPPKTPSDRPARSAGPQTARRGRH